METKIPSSVVYMEDCVEAMKRYPDKYFDLAVVDPPYGIGEDGAKNHSRGKIATARAYTPKKWDRKIPDQIYFLELYRVSKNQIIWGGNYYGMPASSCWLVWDKENGKADFADCELAWTSFKTAVRKFRYRWSGMLQENMKDKEIRFHPTQKPVALYDWCLKRYAKDGDKILDTHLGSGSSRIAAYKAGLDFVGFEIDEEYYQKQEERFNLFISQSRLF